MLQKAIVFVASKRNKAWARIGLRRLRSRDTYAILGPTQSIIRWCSAMEC